MTVSVEEALTFTGLGQCRESRLGAFTLPGRGHTILNEQAASSRVAPCWDSAETHRQVGDGMIEKDFLKAVANGEEDVLAGKIWAYSDDQRRKSKRQKDLADIMRLVETHPNLAQRLPDTLKRAIE